MPDNDTPLVDRLESMRTALKAVGYPNPATDKAVEKETKRVASLLDLRKISIEIAVSFTSIVEGNEPSAGIDARELALYLLTIPGRTYITGIEKCSMIDLTNRYKITALSDTLKEGSVLGGNYKREVYEKQDGSLAQYTLFQGVYVTHVDNEEPKAQEPAVELP